MICASDSISSQVLSRWSLHANNFSKEARAGFQCNSFARFPSLARNLNDLFQLWSRYLEGTNTAGRDSGSGISLNYWRYLLGFSDLLMLGYQVSVVLGLFLGGTSTAVKV